MTADPPGRGYRIEWLDLVKAFAFLWIFANHVAERIFGAPYVANPYANWPPLSERVAQLAPLDGFGIWTIPANALRYIGWFGDQGVQLFLIASGFGLTWSLLQRKEPYGSFKLGEFYLRRAERIFPLWWGAHLLFAATWLLVGWGLPLTDPAFYLSLLGIRLTPALFYYFSPAWWYFGLLVQLYLVFPLLWQGLRRLGPTRLLLVTCAGAFLIRGVGLFVLESYLDPWQRGAVFVTRLPEFVFGISLAAWLMDAPEVTTRRLRSPAAVMVAVFMYAIGTALSLTLAGMTVAPFVLGVSAFVVLFAITSWAASRFTARSLSPGLWIGQHSYSLYLVHHPWIILLVPAGIASPLRVIAGIAAAALFTVVTALLLERGVQAVTKWLRRPKTLGEVMKPLAWLVVLAGVLALVLVGIELIVQVYAPQEVLGWGERPSLEADNELGWHLVPSQTTRLRWESYDYTVTANELGFPGPSYPEQKDPSHFRILVTGDAFTSAEGVDTKDAWPRLLEKELSAKLNKPVEVLDFAITGYSPIQYADVVSNYAPLYHPDLIIVETFVNDFEEVLASNFARSGSIGFDAPAPNGLYATSRLLHLKRWIHLQLIDPLREFMRDKPRPEGYFLGNFRALERTSPEHEEEGRNQVTTQLDRIRVVADTIGAPVIIVMAPAAPQVCDRSQLTYYPHNVDLQNSSRYDVDLPQRLMSQITTALGIPFYDLRRILTTADGVCPYQASNMHWTVAGHQEVADYLADVLSQTPYAPSDHEHAVTH